RVPWRTQWCRTGERPRAPHVEPVQAAVATTNRTSTSSGPPKSPGTGETPLESGAEALHQEHGTVDAASAFVGEVAADHVPADHVPADHVPAERVSGFC